MSIKIDMKITITTTDEEGGAATETFHGVGASNAVIAMREADQALTKINDFNTGSEYNQAVMDRNAEKVRRRQERNQSIEEGKHGQD